VTLLPSAGCDGEEGGAVALGVVCLVLGMAIGGAGVLAIGDTDDGSLGDDLDGVTDGSADTARSAGEVPAHEVNDRGGDVLVFLTARITGAERQAIEHTIEAMDEVVDHEYWNQEASQAEARLIFADDPSMLQKLENGVRVPESYRLRLTTPDRPTAIVVRSRLADLPGVLRVVTTAAVRPLGG
jgi:hypothetical protein